MHYPDLLNLFSYPRAGAFGFGFEFRSSALGQPAGKFVTDFFVGGIVGEVSEFVRIVAVVVEFLSAVFVDD